MSTAPSFINKWVVYRGNFNDLKNGVCLSSKACGAILGLLLYIWIFHLRTNKRKLVLPQYKYLAASAVIFMWIHSIIWLVNYFVLDQPTFWLDLLQSGFDEIAYNGTTLLLIKGHLGRSAVTYTCIQCIGVAIYGALISIFQFYSIGISPQSWNLIYHAISLIFHFLIIIPLPLNLSSPKRNTVRFYALYMVIFRLGWIILTLLTQLCYTPEGLLIADNFSWLLLGTIGLVTLVELPFALCIFAVIRADTVFWLVGGRLMIAQQQQNEGILCPPKNQSKISSLHPSECSDESEFDDYSTDDESEDSQHSEDTRQSLSVNSDNDPFNCNVPDLAPDSHSIGSSVSRSPPLLDKLIKLKHFVESRIDQVDAAEEETDKLQTDSRRGIHSKPTRTFDLNQCEEKYIQYALQQKANKNFRKHRLNRHNTRSPGVAASDGENSGEDNSDFDNHVNDFNADNADIDYFEHQISTSQAMYHKMSDIHSPHHTSRFNPDQHRKKYLSLNPVMQQRDFPHDDSMKASLIASTHLHSDDYTSITVTTQDLTQIDSSNFGDSYIPSSQPGRRLSQQPQQHDIEYTQLKHRRCCNSIQLITTDLFSIIFLSEEFIDDEYEDENDHVTQNSILNKLELRILNDASDSIVSKSLQDMIERNSDNMVYYQQLRLNHQHIIGSGAFSKVVSGLCTLTNLQKKTRQKMYKHINNVTNQYLPLSLTTLYRLSVEYNLLLSNMTSPSSVPIFIDQKSSSLSHMVLPYMDPSRSYNTLTINDTIGLVNREFTMMNLLLSQGLLYDNDSSLLSLTTNKSIAFHQVKVMNNYLSNNHINIDQDADGTEDDESELMFGTSTQLLNRIRYFENLLQQDLFVNADNCPVIFQQKLSINDTISSLITRYLTHINMENMLVIMGYIHFVMQTKVVPCTAAHHNNYYLTSNSTKNISGVSRPIPPSSSLHQPSGTDFSSLSQLYDQFFQQHNIPSLSSNGIFTTSNSIPSSGSISAQSKPPKMLTKIHPYFNGLNNARYFPQQTPYYDNIIQRSGSVHNLPNPPNSPSSSLQSSFVQSSFGPSTPRQSSDSSNNSFLSSHPLQQQHQHIRVLSLYKSNPQTKHYYSALAATPFTKNFLLFGNYLSITTQLHSYFSPEPLPVPMSYDVLKLSASNDNKKKSKNSKFSLGNTLVKNGQHNLIYSASSTTNPLCASSMYSTSSNSTCEEDIDHTDALTSSHSLSSLIQQQQFQQQSDQTGVESDTVPIAAKFFLRSLTLEPETILSFSRETRLHCRLQHINVVHLLGLCTIPPALAIISEICTNGTLMSLIETQLELKADLARQFVVIHRFKDQLEQIVSQQLRPLLSSSTSKIEAAFTPSNCATPSSSLLSPSPLGTIPSDSPPQCKEQPPASHYLLQIQDVYSKMYQSQCAILQLLTSTHSIRDRLCLARDCANSIAYVHSKNILHRDIKSPNFLVSSDFRVKLTDFGLSKKIKTTVNEFYSKQHELKEKKRARLRELETKKYGSLPSEHLVIRTKSELHKYLGPDGIAILSTVIDESSLLDALGCDVSHIKGRHNLGTTKPFKKADDDIGEYNVFNEKHIPYHRYHTVGNNTLSKNFLNHSGVIQERTESNVIQSCYGAGIFQFDYSELDNVLKYIRHSQLQPGMPSSVGTNNISLDPLTSPEDSSSSPSSVASTSNLMGTTFTNIVNTAYDAHFSANYPPSSFDDSIIVPTSDTPPVCRLSSTNHTTTSSTLNNHMIRYNGNRHVTQLQQYLFQSITQPQSAPSIFTNAFPEALNPSSSQFVENNTSLLTIKQQQRNLLSYQSPAQHLTREALLWSKTIDYDIFSTHYHPPVDFSVLYDDDALIFPIRIHHKAIPLLQRALKGKDSIAELNRLQMSFSPLKNKNQSQQRTSLHLTINNALFNKYITSKMIYYNHNVATSFKKYTLYTSLSHEALYQHHSQLTVSLSKTGKINAKNIPVNNNENDKNDHINNNKSLASRRISNKLISPSNIDDIDAEVDSFLSSPDFDAHDLLTLGVGSKMWMAPEVYAIVQSRSGKNVSNDQDELQAVYSYPADVFSLGIVLYEVLALCPPPQNKTDISWSPFGTSTTTLQSSSSSSSSSQNHQLQSSTSNNNGIISEIPLHVKLIIAAALSPRPEDRPSAQSIVNVLTFCIEMIDNYYINGIY